MKICPTCRRTYEDDGLNFCLEDGTVLTFSSYDSAAPTIVMDQPRPTNPSPQGTGMQSGWQPQAPPAYSMQPKKSSKAWVWVLGILGILVLVCGGGFAGFFYYVASVANTNGAANNTRIATNTSNTKNNSSWTNKSPSPSPESGDENVQTVDLAAQVRESSVYGSTEFVDGELQMASKATGFYYVLVTPDDYKTDGATTRVNVRNKDDAESNLGYGLIIHSNTRPLESDYAFLIDAKRKRFRIVRHEPQDEITVTSWTSSKLIRSGTVENTLEARDKGEKIELYINGELATSITNKQGPKGGVPGLYSGDGVRVAFSKLEIVK